MGDQRCPVSQNGLGEILRDCNIRIVLQKNHDIITDLSLIFPDSFVASVNKNKQKAGVQTLDNAVHGNTYCIHIDISISISIYFDQNQVGLQSQNTIEQDKQAHNMLSQLPAVKDRKVKQQYN